jgi:ABC-type Mn2+/Zn2+ transport system permease subunit
MNAVPPSAQQQRADQVAGFLCAFAFTLAGIALVQRPGLLAPASLVVAFVAVRMTHAHRTLAAAAVIAGGLAFLFGMIISIVTDSPIY